MRHYRLLPIALAAAGLLLAACELVPVTVRLDEDSVQRVSNAVKQPVPTASSAQTQQITAPAVSPAASAPAPVSPVRASAAPSTRLVPKAAPVVRPAGGWYPYYGKKANFTREEFIVALEACDKNKLRVCWQGYSEDLRATGLPVGNTLEEFVAFLKSSDVQVVACSKDILAKHAMGRASADGTVRDRSFQRQNCYQGEQLLLHRPLNRYVLSLGCGNPMEQLVAMTPQSTQVGGGVPNVSGCSACNK